MLEELGFIPENLDYWDKFSYTVQEEGKYKDWLINFHVFLSPITPELERAVVGEGEGVVRMGLEEVIKGKDFPANSTKFLRNLKKCYPRLTSF